MSRRRGARPGLHLVCCDRTGFTVWSDEVTKEWNGNIVWNKVFEPRQPQDHVRGVRDDPSVKDPRPPGTAQFTGPLVTEINDAHAAGRASLTVLDTTRMDNGDRIAIALDNGDVYFTTIQSVDDGETITLSQPIPSATSVGKKVTDYSAVSSADIE